VARLRARAPHVVGAALFLRCPAAIAAGEPALDGPEIRWSAPPECPGEAELSSDVRSRRTHPRAGAAAPSQVTAEVTRDPAGGYRLRLTLTDRGGGVRERRIDGETCTEVTDVAAVVIALASDGDQLPEPAPAPAPAPVVRPSVPSESTPRSDARAGTVMRFTACP
jgi:hypothetical protein